MAKRCGIRVSVGQDARRERPASGMGSPEPHERARLSWEPYHAPASSAARELTARWRRRSRGATIIRDSI
ncbi:MAG: hypothetical protein ACKO4T_15030, partial [Planctomycetaceae bacterium]